MKLKIKITGPKVHEVGYRYFLMSNAIDMGLKGFHARNRTGENAPEVIALVEGDEETIADFKKLVETQKPEHSQVSSIAFEDYDGDIMKTESYAQICSAIQLNKAIPVLLEIRDSMNEVRKNTADTPQILEEIKGMREDIQPGYARQMQADVRAIKERLGMQ
jgi:acylphosphatase